MIKHRVPQLICCLWVMVMAFSPSSSLAVESDEDSRLPLAIVVFLKKPQTRVYELHIHLTNISEDMVSVNVRDLPWNPPNDSKWFAAFRIDGEESPVKQRVQDWKLGSRVIQLIPGESIQDTIHQELDDKASCPSIDLLPVGNGYGLFPIKQSCRRI